MMNFQDKNFACDDCPICEGLDRCDKVQAGLCAGGFCEDVLTAEPIKKKAKPRKTGLAYRRLMRKQKKDRLIKIINRGGYNPAAGYVDWSFVDGKWQPTGKYIKYPRDSKWQRFYKRRSNRLVRRKELPTKGNGYRKNFDYWWALY